MMSTPLLKVRVLPLAIVVARELLEAAVLAPTVLEPAEAKISTPAPPVMVSLPMPPLMVSLPSPPERLSLPGEPPIKSAWLEPTIVSLPFEPEMLKVSVPEVQVVKEKLEDVFATLRLVLKKDFRLNPTKCEAVVSSSKLLQTKIESISKSVGQKISTFLSTGNLVSTSGLDLQQATGFTIVAERLNVLRYMSHFQSVHRGQFFTTMKTTTVRKLLPESWGFLCPVHTPVRTRGLPLCVRA